MTTDEAKATDRLSFLLDRLSNRISNLRSSSDRYRKRYYVSTMSTVILSAAITILAGWKPNWSDASNVVLVLGALSTITSAWGAFFSPRETWLLYSSTVGRLRGLQADIEFFSREPPGSTLDLQVVEAWFRQFQQIMEEHNRAWKEMRSATIRTSIDTRKQ